MILLGSTGSIGTQTLSLAKRFNINVEVLCAGKNITLLNQQIKDFNPKFVVIADKSDLSKVIAPNSKILCGEEGILESIKQSQSQLVLNALVGLSGLKPSLCAMECKKTLALANKESLVSGGWLFENYPIIPVDSEHFGIWYLLNNRPIKDIIITASGGAFRDTSIQDIFHQTAENALKHPNWKMGNKITIDSATMVNKLFELLEARWLFNTINVSAIIERTSSIHAFINFIDGSMTAHFSTPDMSLPIAYALNPIKAATENIISSFSLETVNALKFETIDSKRYPIWQIKQELLNNPKLGTILNSANDFLVQAFLENKIPFGMIAENLLKTLEKFENSTQQIQDIHSIFSLHHEIQNYLKETLNHL